MGSDPRCSTLTIKYAGLRLTAYDACLLDQREQLPAFNFIAYMTESGDWYEINADTALSTWKDQYRQLQYYALFDKNRKGVYFQWSSRTCSFSFYVSLLHLHVICTIVLIQK